MNSTTRSFIPDFIFFLFLAVAGEFIAVGGLKFFSAGFYFSIALLPLMISPLPLGTPRPSGSCFFWYRLRPYDAGKQYRDSCCQRGRVLWSGRGAYSSAHRRQGAYPGERLFRPSLYVCGLGIHGCSAGRDPEPFRGGYPFRPAPGGGQRESEFYRLQHSVRSDAPSAGAPDLSAGSDRGVGKRGPPRTLEAGGSVIYCSIRRRIWSRLLTMASPVTPSNIRCISSRPRLFSLRIR